MTAHLTFLDITKRFGAIEVLATPFNQLYLFYEAALGLSIWSAILVIRTVDIDELKRSFSVSFPRRAIALYLLVIATLYGAVWLFTQRTRFGAVIRAVAEDPKLAELFGINARVVRAGTIRRGDVARKQ